MGSALNQIAVDSQKLVGQPIQLKAEVRAVIFINVEIVLVMDDENTVAINIEAP